MYIWLLNIDAKPTYISLRPSVVQSYRRLTQMASLNIILFSSLPSPSEFTQDCAAQAWMRVEMQLR